MISLASNLVSKANINPRPLTSRATFFSDAIFSNPFLKNSPISSAREARLFLTRQSIFGDGAAQHGGFPPKVLQCSRSFNGDITSSGDKVAPVGSAPARPLE